MVVVSIDGVIVPPAQATVSVFDRGLLYGDGCFEVLRTWGGAARALPAHLDRLYETARFLELAAMDRPALTAAIERAIAVAGPGEHRIRVILTRGPGALAARLGELGPGRAIVIVEPLPPQPAELALAVVDWPLPERAQRGHKTLSYVDALLARERARAAGADEAIRLDAAGHAVEGATCNLFAEIAGALVTPPADRGVLPGIVRGRVLAICAQLGVPAREGTISVSDLRSACEVFATSSLRGVVPVTRIDEIRFTRGPLTERLTIAYLAAMRGPP